jgi:hypothetical protein
MTRPCPTVTPTICAEGHLARNAAGIGAPRLWSNACGLLVAGGLTGHDNQAAMSLAQDVPCPVGLAPLHDTAWFGPLNGPGACRRQGAVINWDSVLGIDDRRHSRRTPTATSTTRRRTESRMPTYVPRNQPNARPIGPTDPLISASRGHVLITGSGFLPNRSVTIRITYIGEDVVDYLTYISDADGYLSAPLPETAVSETGHIAVTDHRPDPDGDGGLLWSNTVIVTHTGT